MIRTISFFLIIPILIFGCRPSAKTYDKHPITFIVSKELNSKEVSEIIASALLSLRWTVGDIKDGSVSAVLNHRNWQAKVEVKHTSQNQITILCDSLHKFEKPNPAGFGPPIVEYNKEVPFNWLMNIKMNVESGALNKLMLKEKQMKAK